MTRPFVFLSFSSFETPHQTLVLEGFALSRRHVNTHSFSPPSPSRSTHPSIHPSINVTLSSVFALTAPLNPYGSQTPVGHRRAGSSYSHNKQTVTQRLLWSGPSVPDSKMGSMRDGRHIYASLLGSLYYINVINVPQKP